MGPLDVALLSVLISGIDGSVNYRETKTLTRMDAGISEDAFRLAPWDNHRNLTDRSVLSPEGYPMEDEENMQRARKRFFGHRRRMHFAMLSIMYKMGVMTTLLVALAVLALKSLTIGVILLIFAFGGIFSKFHKFHGNQQQPIHVHVHSGDVHGKVPFTSYPSSIDSSGWDRVAEETDNKSSSPRLHQRWYRYYGYPYYGYRPKGFRITWLLTCKQTYLCFIYFFLLNVCMYVCM